MSNKRNRQSREKSKKKIRKASQISDEIKQARNFEPSEHQKAAAQFIQALEPEVKCEKHGIHNRYLELAIRNENGENQQIYYCVDCLIPVLDKVIGRMEVTKERRMVRKKVDSQEDLTLIDPKTLPSEEIEENNIKIEEKEND